MKKIIVSMILVIIMIVAACVPAFASEPAETTTGVVNFSGVAPCALTYYYVNANSVNVRSGPSTSYSVLGMVNMYTVVRYLGSQYNQSDGHTWFNV